MKYETALVFSVFVSWVISALVTVTYLGTSIMSDCEDFGVFRVGGNIYECRIKEGGGQ